MTDNTNNKLNKVAADLPEVPRTESGEIDIEKISIGKDEKNNYIVPDDILDNYYRELPKGIVNKSGTWRATGNGGKLKIFGADPESDKEIQKAGGEALQAALKQRRSCKEILEELARKSANPEIIDRLGMKEGTSNLEAMNYAQYLKAQQGDTKAAEFVRDTIGEKPVNEIAATIETTPEDIELVKRVASRCESDIS